MFHKNRKTDDTPVGRLALLPEDSSVDEVIEFLAAEDQRLFSSVAPDRRLTPDQEEQYKDFFRKFGDRYGEDSAVAAAANKKWGGMPAVLGVGANLLAMDRFPLNRRLRLDSWQQDWARSFAEYVMAYETAKQLSFTIRKPDSDEAAAIGINIEENDPDTADTLKSVTEMFGYALQFGGTLYVRFHGVGQAGKDVVNGFSFEDGKVERMSPGAVKALSGRDPQAEYALSFWTPRNP